MESYNPLIDYTSKYLKYKTKYLNLKNSLNNNLIGGDIDEKTLKIFEEDKEFHVTLKEPWFSYIKEGKKIIEGRINKGLFKHLKVGDIIVFKNGYDKVKVKIINKKQYPSFEVMLQNERLEYVLPNVSSVIEGVNIYRQYFTEEVEKENGVVAIKFEKK